LIGIESAGDWLLFIGNDSGGNFVLFIDNSEAPFCAFRSEMGLASLTRVAAVVWGHPYQVGRIPKRRMNVNNRKK